MRIRGQNPGRPGTVLVLFVLLVFGLLALAGLTIDLGLALAARRQMQTAADSAALKGLRFRDQLPPGTPAGTDPNQARREAAQRMLAWAFDDNFDTSSDQ